MTQNKLLAAAYTAIAVLAVANVVYAGSSPACMGMVCVDYTLRNPPQIFLACNAEFCDDTEQCPEAVTFDGFTYCTCPTSANFCNIGYHDNQNGTVTLRCVQDEPCPGEEVCQPPKYEEVKPPPDPITNFWCVCE